MMEGSLHNSHRPTEQSVRAKLASGIPFNQLSNEEKNLWGIISTQEAIEEEARERRGGLQGQRTDADHRVKKFFGKKKKVS